MGSEFVLRVSDTGIGIPVSFYRVDQARTREEGGSGLGLSIVKHIMEAHHGRVSVKSQIGSGTVLTLVLPDGAATATA